MFNADDTRWMLRALELAAQGIGTTTPNPSVGCVIVDAQGQLLGEGHTQPAGQDHAEKQALKQAAQKGFDVRGATAYVTLEPCSHFGRTPPCADALIAAGIARVITALEDPNPLVAGNGLRRLQAAGIEVASGLMAAAAHEINIGFMSRMRRSRPWLRVKTACSLDGRTALLNGQSKWITSDASRADVQKLRARSCAMLTGIGTILADDPQLTVRDFSVSRQPLRVIVDSQLRMPLNAKILQTPGVLIVCAVENKARRAALEAKGAEVFVLEQGCRVDLSALLKMLAERGCNEVTVEAGAELVGGFARAGLIDEWLIYQAPVIIGDAARGVANINPVDLTHKLQPLRVTKKDIANDLQWTLRFTELFTKQDKYVYRNSARYCHHPAYSRCRGHSQF